MRWNLWLYNKLVNRIPGIRERYQIYRRNKSGYKRICAWAYLLKLNGKYYFFRDDSLLQLRNYDYDQNIELRNEPESSISKMPLPEELVKTLLNADVISFDVFDTLVLRKFSDPTDVFYLLQEELQYPDFKAIRIQAEYNARIRLMEQEGNTEVNLGEIWNEMESLTGISKNRGILLELAAEYKSCYANPYFLKIVDLLMKLNKKIIIISDMYLGQEQISKILTACGYPNFDAYYITSDLRKSKNVGDLFNYVRESFGDNYSYYHIGDNELSDYKRAKENGYQALLYHSVNKKGSIYRPLDMSPIIGSIYASIINGKLHNGIKQYTKAYELGFIYGGLFVTGYCQYIHEYTRQHRIDKILFLSRDGDIILKAYKLMYPEEISKCEYVYWSRLASTKMCARFFKKQYMQRMIEHKVNQQYTLSDVFETMELNDMLPLFLNNIKNNYNPSSILNEKIAKHVISFLSENWDQVCAHYDDELNEGKIYYENIIQDAKSAVAIDVGWVGSGPLLLKYLFETISAISDFRSFLFRKMFLYLHHLMNCPTHCI